MPTAHLSEVFGVTRRRFNQDGIGRSLEPLGHGTHEQLICVMNHIGVRSARQAHFIKARRPIRSPAECPRFSPPVGSQRSFRSDVKRPAVQPVGA